MYLCFRNAADNLSPTVDKLHLAADNRTIYKCKYTGSLSSNYFD